MMKKVFFICLSAALFPGAMAPAVCVGQYAPNYYYPYYYYYYPYGYQPVYQAPQPQAPQPQAPAVRARPHALRRSLRYRMSPSPETVRRAKQYWQDAEFRNQIRSPNNPESEVEYMLRSFW